jgi:hypothetical protein
VRMVCGVDDVGGAACRVLDRVFRRDFVVFWTVRRAREGTVRRRRGCGSDVPVASRYGRIMSAYIVGLVVFPSFEVELELYINIRMMMMLEIGLGAAPVFRHFL